MVVPNNVNNVVSASKTNTPSFITSFYYQSRKADPSSANPVNAQIKEFIKNLGTNFDVYQLQGADKLVKGCISSSGRCKTSSAAICG